MASEYTPTEARVCIDYCNAVVDRRPNRIDTGVVMAEADAEFDRFLARVKRDAAREALDGFERKCDEIADRFRVGGPEIRVRQRERAAEFAVIYRDTQYPEQEDQP